MFFHLGNDFGDLVLLEQIYLKKMIFSFDLFFTFLTTELHKVGLEFY